MAYRSAVDGLLAGKLGVTEAASALQIAVRFPDDGGADEVVAAIGEQILGPTDVSLSNWTVRPSSGCSVVLATHTAGVSVDGYTLTLAANPWNIVRTYNLTPGRELLFACRYRLGTASNFMVYDNVYDLVRQLRGRPGRLEHGQDVLHRAAQRSCKSCTSALPGAGPAHTYFRKTRALWLPSSRSSGPLSAALLLDTCSLLQPAQFFVRKRLSEKSEVLVTVSVLDAKSCGAETVPELVTSPHTTLPVDTPPLVGVKVQSRLSQSSGPAEAAPVIVSVALVTAPVAAKLRRRRCARGRGEVSGVGRVVDGQRAAPCSSSFWGKKKVGPFFGLQMEALRDLADDFNVRTRGSCTDSRGSDLDVTQAMAFEALGDVGRQVQAPRPRTLGKSAAEGPNDRLQADLIDFSQNTRGKTKYGLVVMDVFTREAAVEPLQNKNAETVGRATKRAAKDLGNEFATLDRELPENAVHRTKRPEDRNAIAVVDRGIQTLKKDWPRGWRARAGSGATTFSRPLRPTTRGPTRRCKARPRTWRSSRPRSSGSSKTTPTSSSATRT